MYDAVITSNRVAESKYGNVNSLVTLPSDIEDGVAVLY